jgi:hypothetical protein
MQNETSLMRGIGFMYRRPTLCTFLIAVDFLIVPHKGLYGWGGGGSEYVKLLYVFATAVPMVMNS